MRYAELGKRLKKLRGEKTQAQFAQELGISFRAYQRYESGERVPPPHALARIIKECNVDIDWLLTGHEELRKKLPTEELINYLKEIEASYKDSLQHEFGDVELEPPIPFSSAEEFIHYLTLRYHEARSLYFPKDDRLLTMFERLERIYKEGSQRKIGAMEAQLEALDPGERKKPRKKKGS